MSQGASFEQRYQALEERHGGWRAPVGCKYLPGEAGVPERQLAPLVNDAEIGDERLPRIDHAAGLELGCLGLEARDEILMAPIDRCKIPALVEQRAEIFTADIVAGKDGGIFVQAKLGDRLFRGALHARRR